MSPRDRRARGPVYHVEIPPEAADIACNLPPAVKRQVKRALVYLGKVPEAGKPLTGELAGLRSYRARRFRIVYHLVESERRVLILHVGHRRTVYEELAKRLRGQ
jgi:mRNA interferase RelE/StbE